MALTVIGGANFVGRFLIAELGGKYSEVRLADMYPFRQSVYRLQESLPNVRIVKHALSYPTSLKLAMTGADHVVVVTHDYFKLAHSKNFFLERTAFLACELNIPKLTLIAPQELIQMNPLDGDPIALANEAEKKAKARFPMMSVLKTNLLFGKACTSLIIQHALEALSQRKSPVYGRDGIAKFQPVHQSDLIAAFHSLKPGEDVSLSGPDLLSWAEIITLLKRHMSASDVSVGGTGEALRTALATNAYIGDLLYPSHLQQLYWLLQQDMNFPVSRIGTKKLIEEFPVDGKSTVTQKAWHRTILD